MCCDGDNFPADLVMLSSSNDGDSFIKTSQLDGEKNLKKRNLSKEMKEVLAVNEKQDAIQCVQSLEGYFRCELPNADLHSFKGIFSVVRDMDGDTGNMQSVDYTLDEKQLLLKGASLANTEWIVGICIYSGDETKIMMNS